jgi:SEC-C motif-containing protein
MAKKKPSDAATRGCPCGSGQRLADCCQPLLQGDRQALTAEQLMRSRYSAYCLQRVDYLLASWHARTRPERLDLQPQCRWLGLQIIERVAGQAEDSEGIVAFVARYRIGGGRAQQLRERSRFRRESGRWYYLDGEPPDGDG